MKLIWHESAWHDYLEWQATDKKKLKRINQLIRDISRNGYNATGKPESLSGNLSGFYSVRITHSFLLVCYQFGNANSHVTLGIKRGRFRLPG